jgi:formamidopyrimidine-DNA glycosylase
VSIELPEAYIVAKQLNTELPGKEVAAWKLQNHEKYRKLGFINMYLSDFDRLLGCKIESAISRGNTICVKLSDGQNLILAPEYGGVLLYHPKGTVPTTKFTLKLDFTDQSAFTVTLTGMGIIKAHADDELQTNYVYKRDFSATASPVEDDFTFERFIADVEGKNVNLKTALVGKDASVVGLGNSLFQDIIYRAHLHPKRKASELSAAEKRALFEALHFVVWERIRLGGKDQFVDLYGKRGRYVAAMGPNMKSQACPDCGVVVEKLSFGGGQVYICSNCQK